MGKELRRVPLDFNWPLKKRWGGYLNPHRVPCPEEGRSCDGGWSAGYKWVERIVSLLMLAGEEASYADSAEVIARWREQRRIYPHPWLREIPLAPEMLRPDLAQLTDGLAGEAPNVMGYGASATHRVVRLLMDAAGLPESWMTCPVCAGHGIHPDHLAAYEAWERTPPPEGDGFQLWETTSEGSPVSPVFATLKELCAWCESNATTLGSARASAAKWEQMLGDGFVAHVEGNRVFM